MLGRMGWLATTQLQETETMSYFKLKRILSWELSVYRIIGSAGVLVC